MKFKCITISLFFISTLFAGTTEKSSLNASMLEAVLQSYLMQRDPSATTQMISVNLESTTIPLEEIPKGELIIDCRKKGMISGKTLFMAKVDVPGRQNVEFHIVADIVRYENVAVLTHAVERYQELVPSDYTLQTMRANWPSTDSPVSIQELTGMRTKRSLPQGRVLLQSMVEAIPLVKRGAQVNMSLISKNVSISMPVICQDKGGRGDVIRVKDVNNGSYYYAEILGPSTVMFKSNTR